ncbi:MAG: N-acetyltransferase family protein [Mucilaginibacter sp.]
MVSISNQTGSQLYRVRDANSSDIEQMSVLITELGYPTTIHEMEIRFASISPNANYRTLVIVKDDLLVGMAGLVKGCWYEKNGSYVRLLAFVIKKDHRGQGLGKKLLQEVEQWAADIGANSIVLSSGNRDERIAAHQFYQSQGYDIKSSGFIKILV